MYTTMLITIPSIPPFAHPSTAVHVVISSLTDTMPPPGTHT